MSIEVGQAIPSATLTRIGEGIEKITTTELFGQGKAVLFAVPGAFTPTCSEVHLPGFVQHYKEFADRGIKVYCTSVNDPFVMHAWGLSKMVPDGLLMLADGNGELTQALGLEMDASGYGMGMRSRRFALYAENGVVKQLWVEAPGEFKVSSAEAVLAALA